MQQLQSSPPPAIDPGKGAIMRDRRLSTWLMYGLLGLAGSLAFLVALYAALRIDSTLTNFIWNTYPVPLYFWPYAALTLAAVVLFGVNVALFTYRWRKFGPPRLLAGAGTGAGSTLSVAASACPACGSTILAAIGIAGGLVAFPLAGLELKGLSVALMALPIWLIRRDIKRLSCGTETCPPANDHRFKGSDRPWLAATLAAVVFTGAIGWDMLKTEPVIARALTRVAALPPDNKLFDETTARVVPEQGFHSKIALRDSVVKLVELGVVDRAKFEARYQERGGLPQELKAVLEQPSEQPIRLTRQNAAHYVNLLWPLGLANAMSANRSSPSAVHPFSTSPRPGAGLWAKRKTAAPTSTSSRSCN